MKGKLTDLKGRLPTVVKGARYSLPLKSTGCFSLGCSGTSTCIALPSALDCFPLQKPQIKDILFQHCW